MEDAPRDKTAPGSAARSLIVALQFLTRLRTPHLDSYRDDDLARSAPWVPAVGLIVGGVVAAAACLGAWLTGWGSGTVTAGLALGAWVWVTGALHLDGLADSTDGLAAAHGQPDRFLQAARDAHVGAFGVVALIIVLLIKFAALSELAAGGIAYLAALILVPAWARWVACVSAQRLPALSDGLGASFRDGLSVTSLTVSGVLLGLASVFLAPVFIVVAVACAILAVWFWRSRLGGITGDTLGATIEVVEALLLLGWLVVPLAPLLTTTT